MYPHMSWNNAVGIVTMSENRGSIPDRANRFVSFSFVQTGSGSYPGG